MEIQVRQVLKGHALRDQILERYGTRSKLNKAARGGDVEARSALVDLRLLEEDPRRLETDWTLEDVGTLTVAEVSLLTPKRLSLFEAIQDSGDPQNVTRLATVLGRDKKNVSEDVGLLERLGLVWIERKGRQALVRPVPGDVHIVLRPTLERAFAGSRLTRQDVRRLARKVNKGILKRLRP